MVKRPYTQVSHKERPIVVNSGLKQWLAKLRTKVKLSNGFAQQNTSI